MYHCPQCGKELRESDRFCTGCGLALTRPEAGLDPAGRGQAGQTRQDGLGETGRELFAEQGYDRQTERQEDWQMEEDLSWGGGKRPGRPRRRSNTTQVVLLLSGIILLILILAIAALLAFNHYRTERERQRELDPFAGVNVVFSGVSPDAEAEILVDEQDEVAPDLDYVLSRSEGIREGDIVTVYLVSGGDYSVDSESGRVELDEDRVERYLKKNLHIKPTRLSRDYEASNLDHYLSSADGISSGDREAMLAAGRTYLEEQAAKWTGARLDGMTDLGTCILSREDSSELFLVSRVDVVFSNKDYFSYYFYQHYSNVIAGGDGKLRLEPGDFDIPSASGEVRSRENTAAYMGYSDFAGLKAALSKEAGTDYSVEDKVKDQPKETDLTHAREAEKPTPTPTPSPTPASTPTPTPTPTPASSKPSPGGHAATDGQIFADSSTRALSQSEVSGLSSQQAQDAINEIFARAGYIFKESPYKEYYSQFSWYKGVYSDMDSVPLNATEKANIDLLSTKR